jgi:hypothetical protein
MLSHPPEAGGLKVATALLLLAAQAGTPAAPAPSGLPLTGADAERFLATAAVVGIEHYETKGITKPRRATLSDAADAAAVLGHETFREQQLFTGQWLLNSRTRIHEIAAYKLDRRFNGLVPPRRAAHVATTAHSACGLSGDDRVRAHQREEGPTGCRGYNNQMHDIAVMQLTWDTDYNNVATVIDRSKFKIDSSRAFREAETLRRAET